MSIAFLLPLALGSTVLGNPTSSIVLLTGGPVEVESVEAVGCKSGSSVSSVQTTLAKDQSVAFTFATGDFCTLFVDVRWMPSGPLETVQVDGFSKLTIGSGSPDVSIELDADDGSAELVD